MQHVLLTAGRRVSAALTNQLDTVQRLSNLDARPFVPPSLQTLFDTPPTTFIAEPPPLTTLLGSRSGLWQHHAARPPTATVFELCPTVRLMAAGCFRRPRYCTVLSYGARAIH